MRNIIESLQSAEVQLKRTEEEIADNLKRSKDRITALYNAAIKKKTDLLLRERRERRLSNATSDANDLVVANAQIEAYNNVLTILERNGIF